MEQRRKFHFEMWKFSLLLVMLDVHGTVHKWGPSISNMLHNPDYGDLEEVFFFLLRARLPNMCST